MWIVQGIVISVLLIFGIVGFLLYTTENPKTVRRVADAASRLIPRDKPTDNWEPERPRPERPRPLPPPEDWLPPPRPPVVPLPPVVRPPVERCEEPIDCEEFDGKAVVERYFNYLKIRDCRSAWEMLSPDFIRRERLIYEKYVRYWGGVVTLSYRPISESRYPDRTVVVNGFWSMQHRNPRYSQRGQRIYVTVSPVSGGRIEDIEPGV